MSAVTETRAAHAARYQAAFEQRAGQRASEPAWLVARRRAAMEAFASVGFPTTRVEDWRFTNVAAVAETVFAEPGPHPRLSVSDVASKLIAGIEGPVLVFVDGRFNRDASTVGNLAKGLTLTTGSEAMARPAAEAHLATSSSIDGRPFAALNTALFEDLACIEVAPGAVIEQPVQVLYLTTDAAAPVMSQPRGLLVAGAQSQVSVVEIFAGLGPGRYWSNAVTELVAADGAVVDHYRLQWESDESYHLGLTHARVGRAASVSSQAVAVGGAIARHDAVAVLADEGADCTLNGFYYADASRLVDNHTEIDHAMPHGTSHELYKGILADRSRAVFNGRIRVRPDAQKTDAKQTNKTLLLSDNAQINTKPQLEIFANDVKCTHGATVGQLNADALFYLRARGIDEEAARNMLVHAFASDVIHRMKLAPVRDAVERQLALRLPGTVNGR
jgi:Fe-S cluster assembly protein SufD